MNTIKLILVLFIVVLSSCTDNRRARSFGGTETINLAPGERLVTATWKDTDLWYLVKQDTTPPTRYEFKEKSSIGVWNGTIVFIEK